jgi:hypothetical protein
MVDRDLSKKKRKPRIERLQWIPTEGPSRDIPVSGAISPRRGLDSRRAVDAGSRTNTVKVAGPADAVGSW